MAPLKSWILVLFRRLKGELFDESGISAIGNICEQFPPLGLECPGAAVDAVNVRRDRCEMHAKRNY